MTLKIKAFLAFLALGAVFSVFALFMSVNGKSPTLKNLTGAALSAVDSDLDNDGLNNKDESYWNTDFQNPDTDGDKFLDGEEVASGHDPLLPGPNDLLPSEDNLTQKLSSLTLAGLYEGSLKGDNENFETSLNDLALTIIDDAENSFNTDISKIELGSSGADKRSQQIYIEEFSKIYEQLLKTFFDQMMGLESNLNKIGSQGFGNKEVSEIFRDRSIKYKKLLNNFSAMPVPKVWKESHLGVINFTGSLLKANESIGISGEADPIRASLALNKIVDLWIILPDLTKSYSEKIKAAGLSTQKTIFK